MLFRVTPGCLGDYLSSFRVPFFGGGEFFFFGSLGCLFGLNLRDFGSPLPFFPSSHGRTGFPRRPQLRSHPRHQNQEEEEGAVPYGGQGEEVATGVPSPATGVPPPRDTPPSKHPLFFSPLLNSSPVPSRENRLPKPVRPNLPLRNPALLRSRWSRIDPERRYRLWKCRNRWRRVSWER